MQQIITKNKIFEANFYVKKITVADHVLTAIEKTLIRSPVIQNIEHR